jgi:glycosyltransferase involved in cell wall biosynthesis
VAPINPAFARQANWQCRWLNWPLVQHGVNPFQEVRSIWHLYRTFKVERPAVAINFRAKAVIYGTLAASAARVDCIVAIFTGLGHYFSGQRRIPSVIGLCLRGALHVAVSRNKIVFFQNSDDKALFERYRLCREDQAHVLPGSGVNVEEFSPRPKCVPEDRFLLVSRLLRDKGIFDFCATARIVRSIHPTARFIVVGAASSEPTAVSATDLEPWIRDGSIEYRGEIADVRPEIANATAVILPSYYPEGVPRSLLEALAMGRPIITTDMPGCRTTVIEGANGFLVPPRNVEALAEAVLKLVDNNETVNRMGEVSRQLAESRFDVRAIVEQFVSALGPALD